MDLLELYEEHSDRLFRLAISFLRNKVEAEDILQNVFLKLCQKERDGTLHIESGKEKAFLTQMTANACRDHLKSFWHRNRISLEELGANFSREETSILQVVLDLPTKLRIPIYLHYYEGYTHKEIAEFLKISPSAVSMRMTRGKNLLKEEMK